MVLTISLIHTRFGTIILRVFTRFGTKEYPDEIRIDQVFRLVPNVLFSQQEFAHIRIGKGESAVPYRFDDATRNKPFAISGNIPFVFTKPGHYVLYPGIASVFRHCHYKLPVLI